MKWNSVYALDFQAPALMGEQLTYLRGRQFMGHVVVLCFLPYAGLLSVEAMDRHAARFLEIDATLLIVSSGGRPLHRLWIDESPPPRYPCWQTPAGGFIDRKCDGCVC